MNIQTIPSLKVDSKMHKFVNILFLFLHILFSLDFGYVNTNIKIKSVIKYATFAQCLCIVTLYFIYAMEAISNMLTPFHSLMVVILIALIAMQYVTNSLILLNNREKSVHNLQISLQAIDSKLSVDSRSYKAELKIIFPCVVVCMAFKAFINTIFCHTNTDECMLTSSGIAELLFLPQLISIDIVLIMYSYVYYSVYCRLKVFNRFVSNNDGTQVLESLNIYKSIADSLEVVRKYFDVLYFFALNNATPDQIFTTYAGLLKFKNFTGQEGETLSFVLRHMYTFYNFTVLVSPALSAGLVTVTVEKLKVILLERLLRERDMAHEPNLQLFHDYISIRPMRFAVFKVVPLDWSLPILIMNLCITYQITIVQFTQLY